ncbi:hypothetical protein LVJ94_51055 [Pendulispora rubella]|uniref:Uncharacterized protein n=1 Tax=Pendulispora rubella TaxID=2741070 RepID=A0ABZ2L388_9BACT
MIAKSLGKSVLQREEGNRQDAKAARIANGNDHKPKEEFMVGSPGDPGALFWRPGGLFFSS